ncbi:MAG: hydrogenase nickel incorporation protein HypB [Alphaproteobacteria bacterium]|nr:hydrogenase nickel incorporation protein HypB [Alphaproteobacteria bacterium]
MCISCGCGLGLDENDHEHHHHHPIGAVHAPGEGHERTIKIEEDILAVNNRYAAANRHVFLKRNILALNLVSSPGSGKTTLLSKTVSEIRFPASVIEGDQSTDIDAERLRKAGIKTVQINTGRGCHLDAHMVGHALDDLGAPDDSVLFIENVGNLVCPAAFDLGEAAKVVLLSVTEGDDKPLKYPDMFQAARLMLITKTDLLPYVPFDVDRCIANARKINPAIETISLSSLSGKGMPEWISWLESGHDKNKR